MTGIINRSISHWNLLSPGLRYSVKLYVTVYATTRVTKWQGAPSRLATRRVILPQGHLVTRISDRSLVPDMELAMMPSISRLFPFNP